MADQMNAQGTVSIGIVGAGKVGLQLFQLFNQSELARVAFIVDRDAEAPAMQAARQKRIANYTDFSQAMRSHSVDFIFEVTGSARVAEELKAALADKRVQLITHDMAFILMQVIDENRLKTVNAVRSEMVEIKTGISNSLDSLASTIENIKDTTANLRYLSLNARIEAARAGEQGLGFGIVAQQVEQCAQTVNERTKEIDQLNSVISAIAARIDQSLKKLV